MSKTRAVLILFTLGALIYAPWWMVFAAVIIGITLFPFYVEGILFALAFDLIFAYEFSFPGVLLSPTLVSIILFALFEGYIKGHVRLYPQNES